MRFQGCLDKTRDTCRIQRASCCSFILLDTNARETRTALFSECEAKVQNALKSAFPFKSETGRKEKARYSLSSGRNGMAILEGKQVLEVAEIFELGSLF